MGIPLMLLGILGFIVSLLLLIISFFRRKKKKPYIMCMLLAVVCFFVGAVITGTSGDDDDAGGTQSKEPDLTATPAPTPSPSMSPEELEQQRLEYISSCEEINYKDLLRTPDEFIGQRITFVIKISQIMNQSLFSSDKYYLGRTDNEGYEWYLDDEYCLIDAREGEAIKLLEEDVIAVYGEFVELHTFARALTGSDVELPVIEMHYVDLLAE